MGKIIIAIDGYAATGKSSQAKLLAATLGYTYIDTGAMYRAVTLFALRQQPQGEVEPERLIDSLQNITITFQSMDSEQFTFLNGENVTDAIRSTQVTEHVSSIAKIPEVRSFLVAQQKALGQNKGIVMDGRDIGTVVFPNAECKFFLTASPEVRAQRRHLEQLEKGIKEDFEDVLENISTRDLLDSTRAVSPLKKASDAIEIDVSTRSIEEVYDKLWSHIEDKI
ncbi:MAG: (d)CMP kinase [Flavobacteriaceae bacterium]